jgi:uncharacterized iron-regulated membrane protein
MGQPTPATDTRRSGATGRRLWFELHSWVGLKLSLLMAFVCLTGTLAVFSHEIDWLLHPQMRVAPSDESASWGEMLSAVRARYPDWKVSRIEAPWGKRFAAVASVQTPEGRLRFVWIDPHRGHVTGDTGWFNTQRFLRNTHRHLMLPTAWGVPIVSSLAVALLVTFASSFVIYKRWWRGFFSWPRGERRRRFWGDVHRLAGVWSLWFVLLIALTGAWYLVESLGGDAPAAQSGWPAAAAGPGTVPIAAAHVDQAVAQARRDWPGLKVGGVSLDEANGRLVIDGQAEAWLVRDRANAMAFDTHGRLLATVQGQQLSVHQRIAEMADPLHFGTFGGLVTQALWFLFGAALTLLSLSGVYLFGLRTAESLRPRRPRAGAIA